jgi:hypothetical protein
MKGVIQMMWLAKLKPLAAAALILATAGVAVHGRQKPAPEGAREQGKPAPPAKAGAAAAAPAVPNVAANRALAREALALIDESLAMMHQMAQEGRFNIADPSFSVWGRRRLEMLRKAGAAKDEIVAAIEKEIDRLKLDEAIAKSRKESARGTEFDIRDVQFRRLEAEIWLNDEKAR